LEKQGDGIKKKMAMGWQEAEKRKRKSGWRGVKLRE
jgi:hypothetical protein